MIQNSETILITAPKKLNDPTYHTALWASKAVQIAKDLGYNVVEIKGNDVTYDNVTKAIEKYRPRLVSHLGHGCPSSLQGQYECIITRKYTVDQLICMAESPDPEDHQKLFKLLNPIGKTSCPGICNLQDRIDPCSPLCSKETNIDRLRGSIVYAVACLSAYQLGKCAINYGVESYIGYQDLLMFPVDTKGSQNIFGEVQLEFFKSLLSGKTVYESEQDMIKLEDYYIRKFKKIKYISLPLLWNKLNRKVLGNQTAMIYE